MWARHRPDVTLRDLGYALRALVAAQDDSAAADSAIVRGWIPKEEAVVCLSVRSGFDLLMQAIPLGKGDEILFTEVTIDGMVRVAERAGCRVRGAPVDRTTLSTTPEEVDSRITPRTRAIVIAPLFGAHSPITPVAEVARRRGLLVIEDAAQAFRGTSYGGCRDADVSMFSFGTIKRATAAGGAVVRVRDRATREAMVERLNTYAEQSRREYARRLAVLALLRLASQHRVYGALYRLLALLGDPDRLVSKMGKTRVSQQTTDRLRRRPCAALKRVMARRIQRHAELPSMVSPATVDSLADHACGARAATPPRWVLPVCVANPGRVVGELRRIGFDASTLSSLAQVGQEGEQDPEHWLAQTLFLPTDDAMPEATRRRMLRAVTACDAGPISPRSC